MKMMMMMRMMVLASAADNVNANGNEVGLSITTIYMVMGLEGTGLNAKTKSNRIF